MGCLDDKHDIKIREPSIPVAVIDWGREVVVVSNCSFQVGDRDFTKANITLSVNLVCDIPENLESNIL